MLLAHWTYTREEWKAFHRWRLLNKSFFHYVWYWLKPRKHKRVPEIRITPESIWTNEKPESFHENGRQFQRVNIRDTGKLNVMEICYDAGQGSREIKIPIPKGKLREAIEVQEKLLSY
ncbi:MAG TPA: hypothetical protein VF476_07010 [Chitinophagaceae bacterium]